MWAAVKLGRSVESAEVGPAKLGVARARYGVVGL